jgi:hypothetical protein
VVKTGIGREYEDLSSNSLVLLEKIIYGYNFQTRLKNFRRVALFIVIIRNCFSRSGTFTLEIVTGEHG